MAGEYLGSLLGRISNSGTELELQGGLDFTDGLEAVPNPTTKLIDVRLSGAPRTLSSGTVVTDLAGSVEATASQWYTAITLARARLTNTPIIFSGRVLPILASNVAPTYFFGVIYADLSVDITWLVAGSSTLTAGEISQYRINDPGSGDDLLFQVSGVNLYPCVFDVRMVIETSS